MKGTIRIAAGVVALLAVSVFAAERFGGQLVLTCSWQLGTSILVHMTREVAPLTRLVEIDTGLLFAETHATRERLVERYGLEVETLRPLQSVEEQEAEHCRPERQLVVRGDDARRGEVGVELQEAQCVHERMLAGPAPWSRAFDERPLTAISPDLLISCRVISSQPR